MLTPGSVIDGRYEILGPLGAGGMGQVYRARRVRLGDEVALKTLGGTHVTADVVERFLRESRACAQLRHPHIVSILDFDVDAAGQPFLVMELLSGPSVREEIDLSGALGLARTAEIVEAVSGAIQLAHDRGITHRDLKPANIVAHRYGSGERLYKVIDFGLVSHAGSGDSTRLTLPFTFLGTMAYAAPEQLVGEPTGSAADQYALGVVAYEMLTGHRPFDGADSLALAHRVLAGGADPPSQSVPGVPAAADAAILRALSKAPADRWPTVAEFAAALVAALRPSHATPAPTLDGAGLLARYDLGEVLGPGRLGSVVRRGVHRALGVPVAIRRLRREGQPHWDLVKARFLLEAQTLQVRHPHLLHVRDFGEDDGGVFVVTDLVEGPSLRELLTAGEVAWPRARRLILQMTDAAQALHDAHGLLTGVTPETIRVTGGGTAEHVVLTTGGVRTLQDVLGTLREAQLRGQETSALELAYIAPDVLTGHPPDVRADVFTLGALGYHLIAGEAPFAGASLPELIGHMLTTTPPALVRPGVPARAAAALMRSLAADPGGRGSVAELQAAVRDGDATADPTLGRAAGA